MSLRKCALRYLLGWFAVDIVSTVPWDIIGYTQEGEDASYWQVLLVRCSRARCLFYCVRRLVAENGTNSEPVACVSIGFQILRLLRLLRLLKMARLVRVVESSKLLVRVEVFFCVKVRCQTRRAI